MGEIRGKYVYPDGLTPGQRQGGGLSQSVYDYEGNLVTHSRFIPDEDGGPGLGAAIAGLALVGLTVAAVGAASSSRGKEERRRELEWRLAESRRAEVQRAASRPAVAAPAGWYEAEPGLQRWWDGQQWTDHYRNDPRRAPAPPGWYDDASGKQRWWDGQEWTDHYQVANEIPRRAPALPGAASSTEVATSFAEARITMSSAEWQERVRAMLLARAISEQQWRLLAIARIEDADKELLEWQQELAGLTPQQFSDHLNLVLESIPALAATSLQLAQAGWYDDGSGRDRWWDGRQWTESYRAETVKALAGAPVAAPAGWYDDGSGRQRWWDGQHWA